MSTSTSIWTDLRLLHSDTDAMSRAEVEAVTFELLAEQRQLEDRLFNIKFNLNMLSYRHNRLRREAGEIK